MFELWCFRKDNLTLISFRCSHFWRKKKKNGRRKKKKSTKWIANPLGLLSTQSNIIMLLYNVWLRWKKNIPPFFFVLSWERTDRKHSVVVQNETERTNMQFSTTLKVRAFMWRRKNMATQSELLSGASPFLIGPFPGSATSWFPRQTLSDLVSSRSR